MHVNIIYVKFNAIFIPVCVLKYFQRVKSREIWVLFLKLLLLQKDFRKRFFNETIKEKLNKEYVGRDLIAFCVSDNIGDHPMLAMFISSKTHKDCIMQYVVILLTCPVNMSI